MIKLNCIPSFVVWEVGYGKLIEVEICGVES